MLTGLYPPTEGTAILDGLDIRTDMNSIYLKIGICSQHDILWPDLTVEEHLFFYARLRGVPISREEEAVNKSLDSVKLQKLRFNLSKNLSGGEKRRLSIAVKN
jgi:ABC-type multidrug transport system ATPase subunit